MFIHELNQNWTGFMYCFQNKFHFQIIKNFQNTGSAFYSDETLVFSRESKVWVWTSLIGDSFLVSNCAKLFPPESLINLSTPCYNHCVRLRGDGTVASFPLWWLVLTQYLLDAYRESWSGSGLDFWCNIFKNVYEPAFRIFRNILKFWPQSKY